MIGSILAILCFTAPIVLAQQYAPIPAGITEEQLYSNLGPMAQFTEGYGDNSGSKIERVDNAMVVLPVMEETQQGKDEVVDHMFPTQQKENRVDRTKEIHNFQLQKKITNVNNRILHRYLKELLVNTVYNTNVQKVNHAKIMNMLLTSLQETHQPKLLVKYSRQDTLNDLGDRSEAPVIENERQDKVLPAVFLPATAEKIGYNGLALGADISAGAGMLNSAALAKLTQRTSLPVGLNYNNGPGYVTLGSGSHSSSSSSSSGNVGGVQAVRGSFLNGGNTVSGGYDQQQNNGQNYQNQQQNGVSSYQQAGQQQQYNSDAYKGGSNSGDNNNQQQQQTSDDINSGLSLSGQQQQQQVGAPLNNGVQQQTATQYSKNNIQNKFVRANANLKQIKKK